MPKSAKIVYDLQRRILVLMIITWLRNCKLRVKIYHIKHVSAEALVTGRMIPRGLIVYQHGYRPSDSNKHVDIKFSAYDTLGILSIICHAFEKAF